MSKLDYLNIPERAAAERAAYNLRYDEAEVRNRCLIAKIHEKRQSLNGRRLIGALRVDDLARLENCNRRLLAALEAIES